METLVINIRNEKDAKFIKELLARLDVEVKEDKATLRKNLGKAKFKSKEEFMSFAGSMKGQLISKEHLRSISWKKRS
jgi:hypothetical protein